MGTFAKVYRDPATFGLDTEIVARLLPDADLEALPRRAFAFPLLRGHYDGVDLATLDPSQPQARRTLLAADHDDAQARPTSEQHISRHLALSDRLWRGDPPELWEAAQRLLDRGEHRHAVQHTLMYRSGMRATIPPGSPLSCPACPDPPRPGQSPPPAGPASLARCAGQPAATTVRRRPRSARTPRCRGRLP